MLVKAKARKHKCGYGSLEKEFFASTSILAYPSSRVSLVSRDEDVSEKRARAREASQYCGHCVIMHCRFAGDEAQPRSASALTSIYLANQTQTFHPPAPLALL